MNVANAEWLRRRDARRGNSAGAGSKTLYQFVMCEREWGARLKILEYVERCCREGSVGVDFNAGFVDTSDLPDHRPKSGRGPVLAHSEQWGSLRCSLPLGRDRPDRGAKDWVVVRPASGLGVWVPGTKVAVGADIGCEG